MKEFIKRNVKFVVTIGVSFLIIAGLTTALIVTNVGGGRGHGRGHGRDHGMDRSRETMQVELTEEQIAQRAGSARERLEQRLADGRITQEEFDERVAAIESGEYPASSKDRGSRHGERSGRNDRSDKSERSSNKDFSADKAERTTPEQEVTTPESDVTVPGTEDTTSE